MPEAEVTNVRVALRCRPLSKKELSEKDINVFSKEGNIAKLVDPENDKPVEFAFDHVYDDSSKQSEVFQDVGVPVVQSAFDGFNSTVFAYGQTGSGKSWSMTGDLSSESNQGLIPRINTAIFERIAETAANASRLFLVQCSYFEIYNEIIYDLLDPRNRKDKEKSGGLQVKEHPVLGIHVQGLQALVAENAAKIAELMDLGAKNRTVGSTQMNSESSRSHSVCLITVHQKDTENESKNVYSKLNLVDLAGSERADRTGATGARLKEGANINKSLTTLGSVINGLVEQARGKKGVFIPYRNSKLTRVLQESLGGNALCTMLATLSPARANVKETMSTLRYAARAKTIKKSVTKNEESGQIDKLNEEVARLKKMLAEKAAEAASGGGDSGGGPVNDEELKAAQSMLSTQITEMEALTRQTWQDKQQASRQHEAEVAKMRRAHKDAARRAEAERRKRFQLLRQKGDVELSVKELALPSKWADAARALDALKGRDLRLLREAGSGSLDGSRSTNLGDSATLEDATRSSSDAAAAAALVTKGAADAMRARLDLLLSELGKLGQDETLLLAGANNLVGEVERALEVAEAAPTPSNGDDRKEALRARSGGRRGRAAGRARGGRGQGGGVAGRRQRRRASSGGGGGCLGAKGGPGGVGWRPDAGDDEAWLGFEFDKPTKCREVVLQSGLIAATSDHARAAEGPVVVDGAAPRKTVAALGEIISWSALKFKSLDKVEKLLNRPPVRFLQDVLAATDAASPPGWLGEGRSLPVPSKDPDAKKAYFDSNGAWIPWATSPPVDASTGRAAAPDAPAAAAWRLRVAAWAWDGAEAPPGSCRAGLVGAPDPEPEAVDEGGDAERARAVCAAASAALEREASLLTGAMRAAAGRVAAAAKHVASATRARSAAAGERGKYEEVKAEVETLRAAAARHNAALEAASAAEATCRAAAEDAAQRAAAAEERPREKAAAVALAKSDAAEGARLTVANDVSALEDRAAEAARALSDAERAGATRRQLASARADAADAGADAEAALKRARDDADGARATVETREAQLEAAKARQVDLETKTRRPTPREADAAKFGAALEELQASEAKVADAERGRGEAQRLLAAAERHALDVAAARDALEGEAKAAKDAAAALRGDLDAAARALDAARATAEADLKTLRKERDDGASALADVRAKAAEADADREAAAAKLAAAERAAEGAAAAKANLETALAACRQDVDAERARGRGARARDAEEEQLSAEVEIVREERDVGSEAYVRLTNQLNETRDELSGAGARSRRLESEQHRTRQFLSTKGEAEAAAAATAKEHAALRSGLDYLRRDDYDDDFDDGQ
ncbi:hypothetical protein JL720_2785 [Aureococcus anophagefferens]|nr:hypothetical protein JL720_2785 [Aureococcus anophagefferens]